MREEDIQTKAVGDVCLFGRILDLVTLSGTKSKGIEYNIIYRTYDNQNLVFEFRIREFHELMKIIIHIYFQIACILNNNASHCNSNTKNVKSDPQQVQSSARHNQTYNHFINNLF